MNKAEQKFVETLSEMMVGIGKLKGENEALKNENKFLREKVLASKKKKQSCQSFISSNTGGLYDNCGRQQYEH